MAVFTFHRSGFSSLTISMFTKIGIDSEGNMIEEKSFENREDFMQELQNYYPQEEVWQLLQI